MRICYMLRDEACDAFGRCRSNTQDFDRRPRTNVDYGLRYIV